MRFCFETTFDMRAIYVSRVSVRIKIDCTLAIVANVVPELLLADLNISEASVIAWWLIGPQAASERRQV